MDNYSNYQEYDNYTEEDSDKIEEPKVEFSGEMIEGYKI